MKFSLVVTSPGKMQGKALPINLPKFTIGREARCHLRPASALISNRHCTFVVRGDRVFVEDLKSTNGTFVNGSKLDGEKELKDHDAVLVGPITFEVRIERQPAVDQPTPLPPAKAAVSSADEEIASMLLSLPESEGQSNAAGMGTDEQGVPSGSTVLEVLNPAATAEEAGAKDKQSKYDQAKQAQADTSVAASAILTKYLRRR